MLGSHGLIIATFFLLLTSQQALARTIGIKITKLVQHSSDIDGGPFDGPIGDFYPIISVNQGLQINGRSQALDYGYEFGTGYIFPYTLVNDLQNWSYKIDLPDTTTFANVAIFLMDADDTSDDDTADISPVSNRSHLELGLDLNTGRWIGDVEAPRSCATGTGSDAVTLCFEFSVIDGSFDADGDGLMDQWEMIGYNPDGNGTVDVNLPAMGTNPRRKDILVEVDCVVSDGNGNGSLGDAQDHSHCPSLGVLQDVVTAFAEAPVNNIDGTQGVQLILDAGNLFGTGAVTVINGTNGVQGRIGDFGGGNRINENTAAIIDLNPPVASNATDFIALKQTNFNANRSSLFRYSIFGHQTNFRSSQNDCTSGVGIGVNFLVTLGGSSDRDGDGNPEGPCWTVAAATNLIDDDGDGSVDEDRVNGIDDDGDCTADSDGDGVVCNSGDNGVDEDGGFSIGSRNELAGTFMHELGHTLNLDHGGDDGVNNKPNYLSVMNYSFQSCAVTAGPAGAVDFPGGCTYSRRALQTLNENSLDECFGIEPTVFGNMNWNGIPALEGSTCPANMTNVMADINTDTNFGNLSGPNDWNLIVYSPSQMAAAGQSQHFVEADPPLIQKSRRALQEKTKAVLDLRVTAPATIKPGEIIPYVAQVNNKGRGPALNAYLIKEQALLEYRDIIKLGAALSKSVGEAVDAKACPQDIRRTFRVNYQDFIGESAEVIQSTVTRVLDIEPPQVSLKPSIRMIWPPDHKMVPVQVEVSATDNCDPDLTVKLVSVSSSESDDGKGDGATQNDIQGASTGSDDRSFSVRAERSGNAKTRTYTIVYEVMDHSGNTTRSSTSVVVGK